MNIYIYWFRNRRENMPNSRYSFEGYIPKNESQKRALYVAKRVVELYNSSDFQSNPQPAIVIFSGPPGVGKTHLLESIRGGVNTSSSSDSSPPIFIDDLFSKHTELTGREHSESKQPLIEFGKKIMGLYESGSLLIATSNFTLEKIITELNMVDTIGRASSRLNEMASRGADVPISGEDHRTSEQIRSLF